MRELLMVRFRAVLRPAGLTDAQWRTLRVLHEFGSVDFTKLSYASVTAKPSLSRVVTSLEGRGLIKRATLETDQRQIFLELTPAGRDFVLALAPKIDEVYRDLREDLGPDEVDEMTVAIARGVRVLEQKL